jgi:hypothetical protein
MRERESAEKSAFAILMDAGSILERAARDMLCASPHNMTERAAAMEAAVSAWSAAQVEAYMAPGAATKESA